MGSYHVAFLLSLIYDKIMRQTWDLDSLYGIEELNKEIEALFAQLAQIPAKGLKEAIRALLEIDLSLREISSFIPCLISQNVKDEKALQLSSRLTELESKNSQINFSLDEKLAQCRDEEFANLEKEFPEIGFVLRERRGWAREKLPSEKEGMIQELSVDGYHGWGEIYGAFIGQLKIDSLSVGQAENRLTNRDSELRARYFAQWEELWKSQEIVFAQILNHLAGFRWKVYQLRKWDNILKEPLFANRMGGATLEVMWRAVEKYKGACVQFLNEKARLMQVKKMSWVDVEAPLPCAHEKLYSFEEAAAAIVQCFSEYHPGMGKFAQKAFDEGWIEAEDRPNKRPGGFCVNLPKSRQSRIFMTFSGTKHNVVTLAHELGHAYHDAMVHGLPSFAQHYRMNIAETASTFAEGLILNHLFKKAANDEEKRSLLHDKLQRGVTFIMNIHSRFVFEKSFYEKRKQGTLSAKELNDLMVQAQQEGYQNILQQWHPHFWCAKMHFYFTDTPFYNFPYTFGYMLSLALSQRNIQPAVYDALLRESGQMSVESLVKKHLGADLRDEMFWDQALEGIQRDAVLFSSLTRVST